jgi:hypothetical protein
VVVPPPVPPVPLLALLADAAAVVELLEVPPEPVPVPLDEEQAMMAATERNTPWQTNRFIESPPACGGHHPGHRWSATRTGFVDQGMIAIKD